MERIIILVILLGIMVYEYVRETIIFKEIKKKEEFAILYRNKIVEYSNHGIEEDFHWLATNANKMQDFMGSMGFVSYKPPFAHYYINNFMIIVNGIDKIRSDRSLMMACNDHARLLVDSITKYYGSLNYKRECLVLDRKNPLKLLAGGIRNILIIPLVILKEVGLFSSRFYEVVIEHSIVKLITAFAALISVASALVSLVIGWDAFLVIIKMYLN